MPSPVEFLRSSPYFAGLSEGELQAIARLSFSRSLDRNEILFLEGEAAGALYVVSSGRVKLFKTSAEGKEQILRIMHPGESFNEVPVFDGGPNPVSAAALEPTTVLGIAQETMAQLWREYPGVVANALKVMASRLRHLVSLVEDLSLRQVTSRVAKILLEMEPGAAGERLTQQQMAALAGTAREMVSRSLHALEAEGLIKLERGNITLLDRERLRSLL